MTESTLKNIPYMSEETFSRVKEMYPDGEVMNSVRELSGWDY